MTSSQKSSLSAVWFFIVLGVLIAGGILSGPSSDERKKYIEAVLNVEPDSLTSVTIVPDPRFTGTVYSPIDKNTIVTDPELLRAICSSLNKAVDPKNYANYMTVWSCKLRLEISGNTYVCDVHTTWKDECFVTLSSERGFYGLGTNLGTFRCHSLLDVFRNISASED